jgi:hypothetical protein
MVRNTRQTRRLHFAAQAAESRHYRINPPIPLSSIRHPAPKFPLRPCHNRAGGLHDKPDSHANS